MNSPSPSPLKVYASKEICELVTRIVIEVFPACENPVDNSLTTAK